MKNYKADGCAFEFEIRGQKVKVPIEFTPRRNLGGKSDLLARALGKKSSAAMRVLDLTAGLGRDAFHMALIGCEVVALERNITLAHGLQAAWAATGREEKLQFEHAEAREYLKALNDDAFDVIFYDPIFPEKKKSALAGKESQLLQMLASRDETPVEEEILGMALQRAASRVVVKRPLPAPAILRQPNVVFKGKSIRYDVYFDI